MTRLYLALGALALFVLLAVGVRHAVDTYNDAILAVAESREETRLAKAEVARRGRALERKQAMLDRSEEISRARGKATQQAQENLNEAEIALAKLRRESPSVDAFLSLPVPPELRGGSPAAGDGRVLLRPANGSTPATPGARPH